MFSQIKPAADPLSLRDKLINALAAALAILILGLLLKLFPHAGLVPPLMASMGASAFLLFVLPHSPMAQPWPLIGGHASAALVTVAITHLTGDPVIAAAAGVGASVLAMQLLHCLHPPAAATALAVALSDTHLEGNALVMVAYPVATGVLVLLLLALLINNLILRRRYPMRDTHHPHHTEFQTTHRQDPVRLEEDDIAWALGQMDGIVDAGKEDLIDIYELALEHALARIRDRRHAPRAARQRDT